MNGKNVMRSGVLALAGVVCIGGTQADEARGYAGISAGQARLTDFCDDFTSDVSCDDSPLAIRAYAGASLDKYISAEVGFTYVDDADISASVGGGFLEATGDLKTLDGTLLFGTSRENDLRAFAKAGVVFWHYGLEGEVSAPGFLLRGDEEESGLGFRTGLGASYAVNDGIAIRLDWDYIAKVGDDETTGETAVHMFSIGPQFSF
ncbi:outer membrane beta-barrel protein [Marinobacter fonticola]|uniref:outer membrane beta-barrel protein n=1 Tax=Marinobacter fonticola TaxID=2603215 RepID=UPI0011E7CBF3|nr:outer membrane beta-barrel protein [Marinobacter fonticola]